MVQKSIYSKSYDLFLRSLRNARVESGLSQKDVAHRMARTQSFVSKCERGERRIDIIELRSFCDAIGLGLSNFVIALEKELAKKS